MNTHVRERATFVQTTPAFLTRLDEMIEELIAMRDALDGDPDLEDGHDAEADGADAEPALGWTEQEAKFGRYGVNDPGEAETGWNELYASQSQAADPLARGVGGEDDDEDTHDAEAYRADDEASLGWAESESLTGDLTAGSYFGEDEDGEDDAYIADQPHDWNELEASAADTPK